MASFSIDIGDAGSSYEQGVAMPSATEGKAIAQGLSNLSSNIFGALDDVALARRRGQPTESENKRQAYSSFIEGIDSAKGVKGPQATVIVHSALAEYERLGFEVGAAEAAAVKRRTGINIDYLAFDVKQEAMNTSMKKLAENPGYLQLAKSTLREQLGRPPTEQEVTEEALSNLLQVEAASVFLATSKSINRQEFFETYIPNANKALENIRALTVQGLGIELKGGNISSESITKLRTKFDMVKTNLTKPPTITTEDWSSVQSQIDTLGDLVTSLESYDQRQIDRTTAEVLEVTSLALIKMAKGMAETDPIIARALLSEDAIWSGYIDNNYPKVVASLRDLEIEDIVYTDLPVFPEVLNSNKLPDEKTITISDLHSEEEIDSTSEMSFSTRKNAISTAIFLQVDLVDKESLNRPEHRANFFAGVGKITSLMSTTQELFSTEQMNRLFNDKLYGKLKLVKNLDPEEHKLAVARLKNTLQSQFNVYNSAAAGSLTDSFFNITGLGQVKYDLDRRTMQGAFRMGPEARDFVKSFASKHYNKDVTAMVADRGMRLSSYERSQVENAGFKFSVVYRKYKEIQRIANGSKLYINNMKKLGMDTEAIEKTTIKPVEITSQGKEEITKETEENIISISNDEKEYNSLPSGSLYTVGNDATVRRKK